MARLVVLDFDGTMTDAETEGAPFRDGYLEDLALLCGRPLDEVRALAATFEAEVARNPDAHGWVFNGHIVAPAIVDPYLRIMPVARKVFDAFCVFSSEADRTRLCDAILYKYNYQKTRTAFRAGARKALMALSGTPTFVVTNSHTDAVRQKVSQLGADWLVERVFGRAQKYAVDPLFDAVPERLALAGLSRPVLLRRRAYHDVLDRLRQEAGAAWSDVLVVGDIFELDLSLPLSLGARVGLVVNDFTPAYEREFVAAHERGALVTSLTQLPALAAR